MFKFIPLLMAGLLFACEQAPAYAAPLDTMRSQTVEVVNGHSLGSGVFITDRVVLTAAHVVGSSKHVGILLAEGGGWTTMADVIDKDERLDLALVQFEHTQAVIPAAVNCEAPKWGQPIFIVGFPLGIKWMLTQGHIGSINPEYIDDSGYGQILLDAFGNHGNSGGPVFNDHGEVVGIVLAKPDDTQVFSVVSMRAANAFCDSDLLKEYVK